MTAQSRQNAIFVSEDWRRLYEALTNVDFRAADQDTMRDAIIQNIQANYPEEFNDWINSSEFVIKLNIILWLTQNVMFRVDLNSRENFIATAERRESIIRLAQNIAYSVNRVRGGKGEVRINSIQTTQPLNTSDGRPIGQGKIFWNDQTEPRWQEKWNIVLNAALNGRTQIGRPLRRYSDGFNQINSYRFNSMAPGTGVYPFSATSGGSSLEMEIFNHSLNPSDGIYEELPPNPANAMHILYKADGFGSNSKGTGWFLPVKQGRMYYQDELFSDAIPIREVIVNTHNINQDDVWVTEVNENGEVINVWNRADTTFGQGIAFNVDDDKNIFEVVTRTNDSILIRFGDGKFGNIPVGRFRIWFRTSSPMARIIKATDIRNRNVIIPYASPDGEIYNLTLNYSLSENITNAVASESNDDIRQRASKVIYAQDRMVNGEDYNSYFLKDSSILKVKTVNRTFSGMGLSSPLRDPSGTYNNVKLMASDGRLYQSWLKNEQVVIADPDVLSPRTIIDDTIVPLLKNRGKFNIYYDYYSEIRVTSNIEWLEDSVVLGKSRGRFAEYNGINHTIVPVGTTVSSANPLHYITNETLLRFEEHEGELSRVEMVVDSGTVENGVLLKKFIKNRSKLYSVFPPYRYTLRIPEKDQIIQKMLARRTFALRWDQPTVSWRIVDAENINFNDPFSLDHAGDTSLSGKDASWMVKVEYRTEPNGVDNWHIEDRNLQIFFESDREVDFFYANTGPVYDRESGRLMQDTIVVLGDNESRDSDLRRGVTPMFGIDHNKGGVSYVTDGSRSVFSLKADNVNHSHIFVTLNGNPVPRSEWSVKKDPGADSVVFTTPPVGNLLIYYDTDFSYGTTRRRNYVGNDSINTFDIGQLNVVTDNSWVFVNGRYQSPYEDYRVARFENTSRVLMVDTPGLNARVSIIGTSNISPTYFTTTYVANGTDQLFNTFGPTTRLWVFVDGVLQIDGYTLDTLDKNDIKVIFDEAPMIGSDIAIRGALNPSNLLILEDEFTLELGQSQVAFPGAELANTNEIMVWINGVEGAFSFEDGKIFLSVPAQENDVVHALWIKQSAGQTTGNVIIKEGGFTSLPSFLDRDEHWWVAGPLRHSDGFTNPNGIEITNVDIDRNGEADNPFLFREFVVKDGETDLVVWRLVEENGIEVWESLSPKTTPMGTYKNSLYNFQVGEPFEPGIVPVGSVHWDGTRWIVANFDTLKWIVAPDQNLFRKEIGRTGVKFNWLHYTTESEKIDPSPSNVHDTFVLTSGYDQVVRNWVRKQGTDADMPTPETSEQLRIQYADFEKNKTMSDAIVWRPARYKFLFGKQAVPELRAKFLIVKVAGAQIPDNDLKIRVLSAVNEYFAIDNWDFGDSFFYTELASYVHLSLSSILQSVVIVPTGPNASFGKMFQVRAEPDELFISTATTDDIEIVNNFTDTKLRIR